MDARAGFIDSDKTRLRFVPIGAVKMKGGFWKARMDHNLERGIPRLLEHLDSHGVIEAFKLVSGRATGQRQGPYFSDSDLYKWMEGAALALQSYDDPKLKATLDAVIDEVVAAQGEDGYLNTFFTGELFGQRFRNLDHEHELYCAGHLFQAAVAHYRATRDDKLLSCACRFADHLAGYFGHDKHRGVDGHPEVEMALVELYRTTGKRSYLDLAEYFLSQWKFKDKQEVDGHAVRALYLCCGGVDYFAETGDKEYGAAVERLWNDLTLRKMYVTGGVGSYYAGEAIGWPYDLPNERAYAETCAAIASAMFSYRMLGVTGDSKYADEMERAFYNGVISGVSVDGVSYFYMNPLACYRNYQRQEWFGCTCCPTNMVRTLASIPGYMYSTSDEGVWVHLFDNSEVRWKLADGTPFRLKVETMYPWDGKVEITVRLDAPKEFTLFVRIPNWSPDGESNPNVENGYLKLHQVWKPGDKAEITKRLSVSLIGSDPRVRSNARQVAVQRGPIVYCAESIDNPGVAIRDLGLGAGDFEAAFEPGLLGGVVTLTGEGVVAEELEDRGPLYQPAGAWKGIAKREAQVKLIPYYAWANRGPSEMAVWMRRR